MQVDIKLDQGPLQKWTEHPIKLHVAGFSHRKEPQGQPLCGWYGSFLLLSCIPEYLTFSSIHSGVKHDDCMTFGILQQTQKKGMIPNVQKDIANVQ